MTSVVQPMDQGIIKNLKHFNRRLVVQILLSGAFTSTNGKSKINILNAAGMYKAWSQVTETKIANCFLKAGFVKKSDAAKP